MAWTNVATIGAAVIGGAMSKKSSAGPTTTNESKKEPWGPAIPWLTENLKTGQDLQRYYQQNPFNAQQKTGMQNQFNAADAFNSQTLPGLLDFANNGMTSKYSRTGWPAATGSRSGTQSLIGPFKAPTMGLFGQVDWDAQNPYSAKNPNGIASMAPAAATAPAAQSDPFSNLTPEQKAKLMALLNSGSLLDMPGVGGGDYGGDGLGFGGLGSLGGGGMGGET